MSDFDSKLSDFEFVRNKSVVKKEPLKPPNPPRGFQIAIGIYLTIILGLIYIVSRSLTTVALRGMVSQSMQVFIRDLLNILFLVIVIFNVILFYFTLVEPFNLKGRIYQNRMPENRKKRRIIGLIIPSLLSIGCLELIFYLMYVNPNRRRLGNPYSLIIFTVIFILLFGLLIIVPVYFLSDRKAGMVEDYIEKLAELKKNQKKTSAVMS